MRIDAAALIDILRSEKEAYQRLLGLAKSEQELIVKGKAEELLAVIKTMEHQILLVGDLEKRRLALLGESTGQPLFQRSLELSSVIENIDRRYAGDVKGLREEILLIIKELDEVNQANAGLIKRNIDYTDFLLGAMVHDENQTYSNKPNPRYSSLNLIDGRA